MFLNYSICVGGTPKPALWDLLSQLPTWVRFLNNINLS